MVLRAARMALSLLASTTLRPTASPRHLLGGIFAAPLCLDQNLARVGHILWLMTVRIFGKLVLCRSSHNRRQHGQGNTFRISKSGVLWMTESYIQTAAELLSPRTEWASCWPSMDSEHLDLGNPVFLGLCSPSVTCLCQLWIFSCSSRQAISLALSYGCSHSRFQPWKYHSVSELLLSSLRWNVLLFLTWPQFQCLQICSSHVRWLLFKCVCVLRRSVMSDSLWPPGL